MIEGLRGKALKGQSKRLTLNDLYEYIQTNVEGWAKTNSKQQETLSLGAEAKPVTVADNLHSVLPAKLELKGFGPGRESGTHAADVYDNR